MTKNERKEIEACRYVIKRIQAGYGGCKPKDFFTNDVKEFVGDGACASCQATVVMKFLRDHIDLIKGIINIPKKKQHEKSIGN